MGPVNLHGVRGLFGYKSVGILKNDLAPEKMLRLPKLSENCGIFHSVISEK